MSNPRTKLIFIAFAKIIMVIGWVSIIMQVVMYISPVKPRKPIIDNSGKIIFPQILASYENLLREHEHQKELIGKFQDQWAKVYENLLGEYELKEELPILSMFLYVYRENNPRVAHLLDDDLMKFIRVREPEFANLKFSTEAQTKFPTRSAFLKRYREENPHLPRLGDDDLYKVLVAKDPRFAIFPFAEERHGKEDATGFLKLSWFNAKALGVGSYDSVVGLFAQFTGAPVTKYGIPDTKEKTAVREEVEHIKYYFTEPLNCMIYGVVNLIPDHFLTGLSEILGKNAFLIIGVIILVYRRTGSLIVGFSEKIFRLFKKFYGRLNKSTSDFPQFLFTWLRIENEGVKRLFILSSFAGGFLLSLILGIMDEGLFIPGFVIGVLIIFFSFKIYSWVKEGFINSKK